MSESISKTKQVLLNSREIEVPVNWDVVTIDDVAQKTKGDKPASLYDEPDSGRLPYLTISASRGEVSQWADSDEGKRVSDGQILMVWDGASSGTVFKSSEGIIGSTLAAFNFQDSTFDNEFAYYFLSQFEDQISELAEGTGIPHVPRDFIQIFQVLRPPISEQRRIADILSTVDEQIQQTEEIIELRSELKQGILQDILQTGIGHNDLEQENIGPISTTIPKEWTLKSIDEVIQNGKKGLRGGPPGSRIKKEDRVADGFKLYVQDHVINDNFELRDDYISEGKFSELKSAAPKPRDVLVTRRGTIGKSTIFPESAKEGIISDSLIRIRPEASLCLPEFLSILIGSSNLINLQIQSLSHGSSRKGLNNKIVKQLKIPLPPIEEQEKIIQILSCLSDAIEVEERRRSQLSMLKDGLMQDLLTGKVRVNTD
jgi:type I restriction enzyme S subunit